MEINKEQLSSDQKKQFRSLLFRYLDGFAICTTVSSLYKKGIFDFIKERKSFLLSECSEKFSSNKGSLNIGLRLFCSQGWLKRNHENFNDVRYTLTEIGTEIIKDVECYSYSADVLPQFLELRYDISSHENLGKLRNIDQILEKIPISKSEIIRTHIAGCFISPCFVALGMNRDSCFSDNGDFIPIESFSGNHSIYKAILKILEKFKFITNTKNPEWSLIGQFLWNRSTAFGVTVSYLPMFSQVDSLIFGDPEVIWKKNSDDSESHVDRTMNVWGSGGAHSLYFKRIDEIIVSIFDQPLDSQPEGIADMGCGNGQFLEHLYNLVRDQTLRGKHLNEFPLKIIGADFNQSALDATEETLKKAGISHFLISADISKPDDFSQKLKQKNVNLKNCLNVRSFLDHNRQLDRDLLFQSNKFEKNVPGAYSLLGKLVKGEQVYSDLVSHFKKWKPYIQNYGLICLELHTVPSAWSVKTLGNQTATAYDATHGYSDQYIVNFNSFKDAVIESGLNFHPKYFWNFPPTENPAVSINYIR